MTASPGWYQDPGGSGSLRWWDGQVWTEQMAARPTPAAAYASAPVGQTLTAPQVPVPAPHYGGPRVYAPTKKRWRKRDIFYAVVIGTAGVSLLLSLSGIRFSDHPKQPTQATQPVPAAKAATTVQLPQIIDGMTILHTPALDAQVAKRGGNVANFHLTGYYGTDAGQVQALVTVQKTTPSDNLSPRDQLRFYEAGMEKGAGKNIPFESVNAGPLGGLMDCGDVSLPNESGTVCVFSDTAAYGTVFFYGGSGDSEDALNFRAAVESRS